MGFDFGILDVIQSIRTPFGDVVMPFISALGNSGFIWILLACVLAAYPKTRRCGLVLAAALCFDVVLCDGILKHLFARTRPFDVNTSIQLLVDTRLFLSVGAYGGFFYFRLGALFYRRAETLDTCAWAGVRHSVFETVFICTLSDGYSRGHCGRDHCRVCGIGCCR